MRKIAIISGSRADYWLLNLVEFDLLELGAHVDFRVIGEGLSESHYPDIVVLLGDRYEAAYAALELAVEKIPIAHISGGEATVGAIDDNLRHAITKLSYWHFTAHEDYSRRVIAMGEHPDRVFTVGAPGIDAVLKYRPDFIPLKGKPKVLFTYHPETYSLASPARQIETVLEAIEPFEANWFMSGSNADAGGDIITEAINKYAQPRVNVIYSDSFGQPEYLKHMWQADLVVGNSSSGVIEAPAIGVPTVNIGDRQLGRIRAPSVMDCDCTVDAIRFAVRHQLDNPLPAQPWNALGTPGTVCKAIAAKLMEVEIPVAPRKVFYDLQAVP